MSASRLVERRDPEAAARDVGFRALVQQPVRCIEFPFDNDPLQGGSSRLGVSSLLRSGVEIRAVFQQDFRALRRPVQEGVCKEPWAAGGIADNKHFSRLGSPLQQEIQNGVTVGLDGGLNGLRGDIRRNGHVAGGQLLNDFQITVLRRLAERIAHIRPAACGQEISDDFRPAFSGCLSEGGRVEDDVGSIFGEGFEAGEFLGFLVDCGLGGGWHFPADGC